jgi:L-ribulose-5-phosphate 3-epimerase
VRISTSTCIHERALWGRDLAFTCQESIQACVNAGYQVLDMYFESYVGKGQPMALPNWQDWVKEVKDFADSLGVEWMQGHAHFYAWPGVPAQDRDWHEELIRRSIIGAGIMGVKWLVIHPGTVLDETWYSPKKSLQSNLEAFKGYGELASKHNVGICFENMFERPGSRRYGVSVDDLLELYERLNDPKRFGICWDTGHAHIMKINQPQALRQIGKRLKALHIADNKGLEDEHTAPYFGTIAWEPIMKTLAEIEYEGDFTFEIENFTAGLAPGLHERVIRFTYELGEFLLGLSGKQSQNEN